MEYPVTENLPFQVKAKMRIFPMPRIDANALNLGPFRRGLDATISLIKP